MSDLVIFWGGVATTFLAWLHWCKYIKINFRKIDADIFHLVAVAVKPDENGFVQNIKKLLVHWMPLMGGFSAAFYGAFFRNH